MASQAVCIITTDEMRNYQFSYLFTKLVLNTVSADYSVYFINNVAYILLVRLIFKRMSCKWKRQTDKSSQSFPHMSMSDCLQ